MQHRAAGHTLPCRQLHIGAMSKGLTLVDLEALVAKEMLLSRSHLIGHS